MKKRNYSRFLILLIVGLIILVNILGLIIESLISMNVFRVEGVPLRGLTFVSILSFTFITSGIMFWIKFKRRQKKSLLWWHIFMGVALLLVVSKLIWPTALVVYVPYYFFIFVPITIIFWFLVFRHLNKNNI